MPPLRQWIKFFVYSGLCVGSGLVFVNFFVPSDDKFLNELSPELKARYLREKDIRARADKLMQEKIEAAPDKPAWLQGIASLRKFERDVLEQARQEVEQQSTASAIANERERLRALAEKEKKM